MQDNLPPEVKYTLRPHEIKDARIWVKECLGTWHDLQTEEDVDSLSDDQIVEGIIHNFGTLEHFRRSGL
jgi:hypothetical protein